MKTWDAHGAPACGAGTLLEAPLQPCLRLGARVFFPPAHLLCLQPLRATILCPQG